MIGLDFETSGHCARHPCLPVEVGVVKLHPDGRLEVLADHVLKGAKWITRPAYQTHGISLRDTWKGRAIQEIRGLMESLRGQQVCVHAHGTEKKILAECFQIHDIQWVDTLALSRKFNTGCPNHKLATVTGHLGLETTLRQQLPHRKWHRAVFDAAASVLIAHQLQPQQFIL